MREIILKGRPIVPGAASGYAVVTKKPISFFGGVNPRTGKISEKNHPLFGQKVTNKVLVFPYGKGSTVGAYIIYAMAKYRTMPQAIINIQTEIIIASGCALVALPLIDKLDKDPTIAIRTGDKVSVFPSGEVHVYRN